MSGLPKGWESTTLGNVATITTGSTPSTKDPSNYGDAVPFVKPGDLESKHPIVRTTQMLSTSGAAKGRLVRKGAVLVSCIGNLGKVGIAGQPLVTNQQINSVEFSAVVDDRFGYHYCRTLRPWMEAQASATTVTILNKSRFSSAPIVVPPLAEQKRIADKLDRLLAAVDSCKVRLDAIPAILKRFRQSVLAAATSGKLTEEWRGQCCADPANEAADLLQTWMTKRRDRFAKAGSAKRSFKEPADPDLTYWNQSIPKGWVVASVSQFAECLDGIRVPVKKEQRARSNGTYPYYGANGQVDLVDGYIFDDELVLVTEDETFYGREKPIAYRVSGKCWVNNHAHVLRAEGPVASDYLCYALMHYNVLPWLTGTTGRAKLTQAALNSLPIAVPSLIEQQEIVRKIDELFSMATELEAVCRSALDRTDQISQGLLARAFRGELTLQSTTDFRLVAGGERVADESPVV